MLDFLFNIFIGVGIIALILALILLSICMIALVWVLLDTLFDISEKLEKRKKEKEKC